MHIFLEISASRHVCDMSFWLIIFNWPSVGDMGAVTNRRPTARYVRVLLWYAPYLAPSVPYLESLKIKGSGSTAQKWLASDKVDCMVVDPK